MYLDLERTARIDSEFYRSENIQLEKTLIKQNSKRLSQLFSVTDGNHNSISDSFTDEGIPYYRGQDVAKFFIEQASPALIDATTFALPKMKRAHLRKGDLLLSIVGSIGGVSLVSTDAAASCSCKLAILRPHSGVSSNYLAAFLASRYGQNQIKKFVRGAVQMGLVLDDIGLLYVVENSQEFQEKVSLLVEKVKATVTESDLLYNQAQSNLLHHLGLPAQPPRSVAHEVMTNVKTLALSAVSSGRWDAEFYETRHDALAAQLMAGPWLRLGSACRAPINRGVQPEFVDGGTVYVVASKAVRAHGLDLRPDETTSAEFFASAKAAKGRIEQFDVLLNGTGRGTLGRAGIHTAPTPALADNHVTILRLHPGGLNPFFLMLFLNSWPGQLQSEQWQCGSSGQTELYPNQMEQFIIPDLPSAQQAAIAAQVQHSFELRTESETLLTRAKQAVEVAIEQGEAAGLALLAS